jgi:hypothetical protein
MFPCLPLGLSCGNKIMLVGYARVSTADQNPQLQLDALIAADCGEVFVESWSKELMGDVRFRRNRSHPPPARLRIMGKPE